MAFPRLAYWLDTGDILALAQGCSRRGTGESAPPAGDVVGNVTTTLGALTVSSTQLLTNAASFSLGALTTTGAGTARTPISWDTPLTTGSTTTGGGPYNTASVTPVGNKPVYAAVVVCIASGTPAEFTLSGNGLTWVSVTTVTNGIRRLTLFRAQGATPSAGAVTITSSDTMTSAVWSVFQPTGADSTGSDAANSIVQTDDGTAAGGSTTVNTTLSAFGHDENHHLIAIAISTSGAGITPDAQFTQLATDDETATAVTLSVHYAKSELTSDPTFASAAALAVAAEIRAAA